MSAPLDEKRTPWVPPVFLRKLHLVAAEHEAARSLTMTSEDRFRLACRLMSFAHRRLKEQATRHGLTVGEVLRRYDEAERRLRARG